MKFRPKTTPFAHQVVALRKLISTGFGGALLMEPRTGKTWVAINYASAMHQAGKVDRVLVVCPVSIMDVWVEQLATHCPVKYRVMVWDRETRREHDLPRGGDGVLDFVVVNYDAFSTAGAIMRNRDGTLRLDAAGNKRRSRNRGGRYEMKSAFLKWAPHLMVLDESHRIKSPSAAKTRTLTAIGRSAEYRVIMTGTLVTKKKRLFDVYAQWGFLNPTRFADHTLDSFKRWLGVWVDVGYPRWIKNRDSSVEELRRQIHQDSYSVTRAECYDLPARLPPAVIHVPLTTSAKAYDDMAETMVAKIRTGEVTEASIALTQRLRLQQITSGLAKTTTAMGGSGKLRIIGREKLDYLQELLEDQFELDEKVVIGALFRPDIVRISRMVQQRFKVPVWQIHGGVESRDRIPKQVNPFRAHDGAAAFVLQPSAGGEGIDLSTASTMVWYSLTPSYVNFTQAEDRIALSGKANRYVYLLGGPVDELLYETLIEDGDVSKMISKRPERLLREFH